MEKTRTRKLGVHENSQGHLEILVWAPLAQRVHLDLADENSGQALELRAVGDGYFEGEIRSSRIKPFKYFFRLNESSRFPDPASRMQPEGVHGPSQFVSHNFAWNDQDWNGLPFEELVFYELHVGTFSKEGRFDAVIEKLEHLRELGVNALEIMPVAQFPGRKNWGYDGVFPFAVQNSYGGPLGLKNLVNEAHRRGFATFLDVVYNHLGPEGNYLPKFGPYFQDRYHTPWGDALNFDGPGSDHVRRYFIENAAQWLDEFHFDGLRLDAVHAICDLSPKTFLEELAEAKSEIEKKRGHPLYLIAESDSNDPRLLHPPEKGGYGLDAQWNDDFHHTLHAFLTGEQQGYYADFGNPEDFTKLYREHVLYTGQESRFRRRRHGRSFADIGAYRLVSYFQNHDQIGNRLLGDRLSQSLDSKSLDLAACLLFLSPYTPLIFMGEEYRETQPFLYFVDHSDPDLKRAVREGRKKEFESFNWNEEAPDPFSENAFQDSKLKWKGLEDLAEGKRVFHLFKQLIELSKRIRGQKIFEAPHSTSRYDSRRKLLELKGRTGELSLRCLFSLNSKESFEVEIESNENILFRSRPEEKSDISKQNGKLYLKSYEALVVESRF